MRRLLRDRRAVAAVEMALVSTFVLFPLCVFMVEAGQALLTQYRLSRGLHAGLMRAWGLPASATADTVQTAANLGFQANGSGTYGTVTATPVATFYYYCIDPTVGMHTGAAVASGTACPSGQVLATYVNLSITASIPTILPTFNGSTTWSLNIAGQVRIS